MKTKQLPRGWRLDKLGNIAEVNTGNPAPQGKEFFDQGYLPFVRVQDLGRYGQITNLTETIDKINDRAVQECGLRLFPKGTILFPKSGMSALLNHRAILGVDSYVVSHLATIIPGKNIIGEYLFYYLCTIDMARWSQRTNLPSLRTSIISEIDIPVPPLPVQERTVAILQKADDIRRKRQEALKIAEQIIPSLFLEMFGDPATNLKEWEVKELHQVLAINQSGTWGRLPKKGEKGFLILRSTNMPLDGRFDFLNIARRSIPKESVEKYSLQDGDILLNRSSGSKGHIGKVCLFVAKYPSTEPYLFSNFVQRLRPNPKIMTSEYFFYFLRSEFARIYLERLHATSSGLRNINMGGYLAQPIPVPPLHEQQHFSRVVRAYENAHLQRQQATVDATALFVSLLSIAFSGELTAEWEAEHSQEIADRVSILERFPRLTLLAFVREAQCQLNKRVVLVTALMKYAFLLQMEGITRRRFYRFVPYKFGPFTKEVYSDLNVLQDEGLLLVKKEGRTASCEDVFRVAEELATYRTARDEYFIEISIPLGRTRDVDIALRDLDQKILDDVITIIKKYGNLDYDSLLDLVYKKYPRFARRSIRRNHKNV